MSTAAARALNKALIAALRALPSCPRWYAADAVPTGAVLPYGTVGNHNEAREGFFGHGGSVMAPTLKWYSSYAGDTELLTVWGEVFAALDGRTLPLEDHAQMIGRVELLRTYRDPSGYRNAVAVYTARTLAGAA